MSTPYEFWNQHGYSFTQAQIDAYEEQGALPCGVPFTFRNGQSVIQRRFTAVCSPEIEAQIIGLREALFAESHAPNWKAMIADLCEQTILEYRHNSR